MILMYGLCDPQFIIGGLPKVVNKNRRCQSRFPVAAVVQRGMPGFRASLRLRYVKAPNVWLRRRGGFNPDEIPLACDKTPGAGMNNNRCFHKARELRTRSQRQRLIPQ